MTPEAVATALALPPGGAPARRIPKAVLAEHGGLTTIDRKLLDRSVERLDWLATLSPTTIGVAASDDADHPVPAIQVLALKARVEPVRRLLLVLHRAIPVPVLLLSTYDGALHLSLAPLRRAERVADRMVVERLVLAPPLREPLDEVGQDFLASLAFPGLPRTTLSAVHDALLWRVEALQAARAAGVPFCLPLDAAAAAARRARLAEHATLDAEWLAARADVRAEGRLARQVELAEAARRIKRRLDAVTASLADAGTNYTLPMRGTAFTTPHRSTA